MARYIGPKSRIACRSGEAIFEQIKFFHVATSSRTAWQWPSSQDVWSTEDVGREAKAVHFTECLKSSSVLCLRKHLRLMVLPVRFFAEPRMPFGQCGIPFRYCSIGAAARQLVNHRHITADGKVTGIAL